MTALALPPATLFIPVLPDIDSRHAGSSQLLPGGSDEPMERTQSMGLFRRPRQTARVSRKPTWRERRAAERTARAEASLVETEQKIHQMVLE